MPIRVLVEDREIGAQPEMAAVLAEHVGCEAVERRQASPADVRAEQMRDSPPHFFRGLRGERKREDSEALVRGSLYEPGHACRQHAGLAGPRPGEHQHGAVVPVDGLPLVDVQGFEFEHRHALASAAALFRILDSSAGTPVRPAVIRAAASGLLKPLGKALRIRSNRPECLSETSVAASAGTCAPREDRRICGRRASARRCHRAWSADPPGLDSTHARALDVQGQHQRRLGGHRERHGDSMFASAPGAGAWDLVSSRRQCGAVVRGR